MADSLTTANDLNRKRSRSSSPSNDSAAKKANQATAAPAKLEMDEEDDKAAAAAAAAGDGVPANGDNKADGGVAPMNVDSSGIPAKPVGAEVSAQDAQAQSQTAQTITMRTLIVTQDASVIIGKQGKNINEIRDKSGSKLNITESVPGNPERIMSVSGPLDAVSKVSLGVCRSLRNLPDKRAADFTVRQAFGLIVRRINDEPFDVPSVPGSRAVTIR